jgi:hypothetical protein
MTIENALTDWENERRGAKVTGWENRMHVEFDVEPPYDTTFADFIRNWADTLESDPGLLVRLATAMDDKGEFAEDQGLAGELRVTLARA